MPNTNRTTVRYKNKTLDLSSMTREELEPLLTHIRLDLHDIDQQISWAIIVGCGVPSKQPGLKRPTSRK
jgi:hypothetical protein